MKLTVSIFLILASAVLLGVYFLTAPKSGTVVSPEVTEGQDVFYRYFLPIEGFSYSIDTAQNHFIIRDGIGSTASLPMDYSYEASILWEDLVLGGWSQLNPGNTLIDLVPPSGCNYLIVEVLDDGLAGGSISDSFRVVSCEAGLKPETDYLF